MYIAHPTHGARTRPNGAQPPTATRKTTLTAGQCVREPREGRGRNRQTPPQLKKKGGRGGGKITAHSHHTSRQHHKRRPNPPPRRHRRQDPQRGTEGPPSQNWHHQARNSGPSEKGTPKTHRHTPRKKKKTEPATHPEREGTGGQGPQGPGQGQPATHKKKHKTHPDNPTKKGGAQPRPGTSTHAHTAHPGQERRGTSGARPQTRTPAQHPQPGGAGDHAGRAHEHTHTPTPPKERRDAAETQTRAGTPAPHTGNGGVQEERARNHTRRICKPKPKPNHKHHKPQPVKEGRRHKSYPNTPAQGPRQDWRVYLNPHPTKTRTRTQTPHNSRKPSVHSPGTEAARAMQLTRPNEIRSPGVRLHPKSCAALGLEAELATPKHLGTLVPRTCKRALGTGYARKSGEHLGFRPKEGTCASTRAEPSRRDQHVTPAANSPPGVARGRFVGGQQTGLAGCKPPPLFKCGASSCSSQRRRQREPWGASPRPSAPTYLPTCAHLIHVYSFNAHY